VEAREEQLPAQVSKYPMHTLARGRARGTEAEIAEGKKGVGVKASGNVTQTCHRRLEASRKNGLPCIQEAFPVRPFVRKAALYFSGVHGSAPAPSPVPTCWQSGPPAPPR